MALKLEELILAHELMQTGLIRHEPDRAYCRVCLCRVDGLFSHKEPCRGLQLASRIREEIATRENQDRFENIPPKVYKEEADGEK